MKKVLFLYTELAGYVVSCMKTAAHEGLEIHVVRWPVKAEAPFDFGDDLPVTLYDRHEMTRPSLLRLAENIQPSAILCSGWVDKDYVAVCRAFSGRTHTVLLLDNPWFGNVRQRLASLYGRLFLKPAFTHAWVPGLVQKKFAKKLGFSSEKISLGFYCADLPLFAPVWKIRSSGRQSQKVLLYVGRYADFKGIRDLWDAFADIAPDQRPGWKLRCLGTGDLWDQRPVHPDIEHIGFVQPDQMVPHLVNADVFVLPSHREPWGVVVHEMAACGLPMICSDAVGANEAFLKNGRNGIIFRAGDKDDLQKALLQMMALTEEEYGHMTAESHHLSQNINQNQWALTLQNLLS